MLSGSTRRARSGSASALLACSWAGLMCRGKGLTRQGQRYAPSRASRTFETPRIFAPRFPKRRRGADERSRRVVIAESRWFLDICTLTSVTAAPSGTWVASISDVPAGQPLAPTVAAISGATASAGTGSIWDCKPQITPSSTVFSSAGLSPGAGPATSSVIANHAFVLLALRSEMGSRARVICPDGST
jgi:hypothetical protein